MGTFVMQMHFFKCIEKLIKQIYNRKKSVLRQDGEKYLLISL